MAKIAWRSPESERRALLGRVELIFGTSLAREISTRASLPLREHLLDVDSLTSGGIQNLVDRAREFRVMRTDGAFKSEILRGKSIYTLLFENSTRTRVSFEHAGKLLGADVINITASASSTSKGESLLNTGLTLNSMGVDAIVLRHPHSGAAHFMSRHVDASVINAGDGWHAHPTQALLDVLTLQDTIGDLQGRKLAIIGDILHSRVARSVIIAFRTMGMRIAVAGPPTLLPASWDPGHAWDDETIEVSPDVDGAVKGADAVMCLRLQLERQASGLLPDTREYSKVWGIDARRLALTTDGAPVMHPGPVNEGLEISSDVAHGPRSLITDQVENGVAMRMSVLERFCCYEGGTN